MAENTKTPGSGRGYNSNGEGVNTVDIAQASMGSNNYVTINGVDPVIAPTGFIFTALKAVNGPVVLAGLTADPYATPITGSSAGDTIRDGDYLVGRFKTVTRSIASTGVIYGYLGR